MVEGSFDKVPISHGDIWEEYEPCKTEGEDLGSGMCSVVTKARKKSEGADGEEYFIKTIANGDLMWTADNEAKSLELAGNMPGVVKCYKIYDRRHLEGKDKCCIFVLKFEDGGYLEGYCTDNHKDGTHLS